MKSNIFSSVLCVFAWMALPALTAHSQTATVIDRLSGFDEARIAAVAGWSDKPDDESLGREAAKLLYQVNRLARSGTIGSSPAGSAETIGSLLSIRGEVSGIVRWSLPKDLRNVLEFPEIYRVEVAVKTEARKVVVMTSVLPAAWLKPGANASVQETSATGVLVRPASDGQAAVIACPSLAWLASSSTDPNDRSAAFPAGPGFPADWSMLGSLGFDVSLFDGVRARDRQSLRLEDSAAFYPLLRIAASLDEASSKAIEPRRLPPADLLQRSADLVGHYVQMDLQTVRLTRITVTEDVTKEQLGSDHYWQIDALGDLGNVVIRIESKEQTNSDSNKDNGAIFENRYPVSIAVRNLPPFLLAAIEKATGEDADVTDVAMFSTQIRINAVFFRLWSYDSDFMAQHGGGKQFGPLLIASRIEDIEPARGEAAAVSYVGWYVAAFALLFIAVATIAGLLSSRRDAAAKRRNRSIG